MSKQVSDRVRTTRTVTTLVHDTAEVTGRGLETTLFGVAPEVGTPTPLNGKDVCLAMERYLRRSVGELIQADQAHERELSDDAAPRARRDDHFQIVRRSMSSLRSLLEGVHGSEGLGVVMMGEPCPNDPTGAHQYARAVGAALADATITLPAAIAPGATFDRSFWATHVTTQAEELRAALDRVKSQEVAAKQTLARKQAALEVHDQKLRAVIDTVTAWWKLIGMPELIDKLESDLRPRQPGEPESDAPPPNEAETPALTGPVVEASGS